MKNLSNIEHELDIVTKQYVDNAAEAKVDKVEGKQLSTNDFSNEDKEKLNSLENYILPTASADALGGIKIGENLTIAEDGTLNAQTGAEDVIIPYKTFTDYSDEEKTSIADKLLNCIDSIKNLTKICYLEVMGTCYLLSGIVNSENDIEFIFIFMEGFTQGQVTYTVSTTSNTLINVTLNTSNPVDSAMSDTSENPVQNKVIKSYVDKSIATLVDIGNIDWDEVTPNTKGYIANKPFGRINTFANTTNILFENTTHTGNMKVYDMIFNIDFPSGFAENIENITTATLQYGNKTYDIRTIKKASLKRTCTENQTYSKILEYTGEFNTESIVFELELSKKVRRTNGTTTLQGKLICDVRDLIASGIISGMPEDGTVNLTFGLKVTTTGTEIKVIDSTYLPIASANTLGAIKVGNNLTIDENGVLNGNDVDLTSYAKKNELPTKVSDLTNDSLFITNTVNNLTNYYTKTETYTQEQINDLISAAVGLKLEVVSVLPTTDISTSTIYLKGTETEGTNDYEEWIYVNNNWELIGTTEVDLTPYTTKEYTDNTFAKKSLYSDTTINIGRTSGTTVGQNSTAEGSNTTASGDCSHAEGDSTKASGYGSHAEGGNQTKASGLYSHAEGQTTEATGSNSHAEGSSTKATQSQAHAEGSYTTASGVSSHAEGDSTKASGNNQHVQGKYNIEDTTSAHIVGNGSSSARSNAHTLDWSGNAWFSGDVYTGSTSGTNKDDGSKKLATEEYVDSAISTNAMPASSIVNNFWIGTQTEYDAIATKSSTTLYMIKEG